MKNKAARFCLLLASATFIFGGLMLCHCPGLFAMAAILALVSALIGVGLVRAVGVVLLVACLVGTYQSHNAEQRQQEKIRKIQE